MSTKLENILKWRKCRDDAELLKALDEIIDAELLKSAEKRDSELVDEAIQLSLYLQNKDVSAINSYADGVAEQFLKSLPQNGRQANRNRKAKCVKLKRLIPVAAVVVLLVSGSLIADAFGFSVISLTKQALMNMKEKQTYKEGNVEIVLTDDTQVFNSVDDFKKANLFPSAVLPYEFLSNHPVKTITVYDYGDVTEAAFTFKDKELYISVTKGKSVTNNSAHTTEIGNFNVVLSNYDGIFQGEFQYNNYLYLANAPTEETMREMIEDMR